MTHYLILSTFSEDSRIWTFSLSVSAGLVAIVAGIWVDRRARRKKDTLERRDMR